MGMDMGSEVGRDGNGNEEGWELTRARGRMG